MADWLWLALPILAVPLGYGAGRFTKRSRAGLTVVMLLPALVAGIIASDQVTVTAFFGTSIGALILFSPALVAWLILAIVGFTFGRRRARRAVDAALEHAGLV